MRNAFRTRILILMIITILIPSVVLSVFIMHESREYYDNSINPMIDKEFENDLYRIESFFSDSRAELELYASMIEINENEDYIFRMLDNFLENNPTLINAYYTSEIGENYLDHNRKPAVDGRERNWYKDAKLDNFVISEPYVDALTDKWVVTLSIAAYRDDVFHGVMGVDFLVSDLVASLPEENNISKSNIILKNKQGKIIYYDESISSTLDAKNILLNDDEKYVVKSYELSRLHLDLFIASSVEAYNHQIKNISYDMSVILVFIGVITVILAFSSSVRIAVPLNEFRDAIFHVNKTHEVYSSGHQIDQWDKEFVTLFNEFNKLIEKFENDKGALQVQLDEVSKTNQVLMEKNIELENLFKNQKLLDKKIRVSQKEYHSILNNIKGMVWVLDKDGKIDFVNDQLNLHLNFMNDELIGREINTIVSNRYEELDFFDLIKTRDYKKFELNMIDSHGQMILVEASTSRVFDDGELLYVYGICRDIRNDKELLHNFNVKLQEQNLIMDLTETASMNISLHQVINSVFEKLDAIFGWSAVTIRFLNEDNDFELIDRTSVGDDYITQSTISYDQSCLGYVSEKNEILYVYDDQSLPVEEAAYKRMLSMGYAIVFIPVGNHEIGKGIITLIVEKQTLLEKQSTLKTFTNTITIVVERALIYEKLRKDYLRMIQVLAEAGDDKETVSVGHSNRVADIVRKIGEELYLDDDEIIDLEVSGLLHDIGKIGISDQYLSKEAQESDIGKEKIREHPVIGKRMLKNIGLSENILDGIEYHHLNYDLTGYPQVDHMEIIPLFARILRVADQFDIYKTSGMYHTSKDIWFEMAMSSGSLYCPQIMKVLKTIIDKDLI
ncbi:HD domain-containing protein [Acidaminobacter sp. JC074]|uniref:HD domain-containing phosphohydrolase n=1 Tax=Acidaminobacter sp. JC074 TaxID=2530199 RepID=UPI001F0CFE39|nr:HD domain-containing phosphohydrolase [Acidaminobacter sp. JC074]MCH4891087.1 HD domain-containing protein [Acidaminobacter sp. JC074]